MNIKICELLFTGRGRVPRITYWISQVVVGGAYVGLQQSNSLAFVIMVFLLIWPTIAIMVKRCHDRDKSGLWLLLLLIPIVGPVWALIELGILKGTEGRNSYGKDPLQSDALPA